MGQWTRSLGRPNHYWWFWLVEWWCQWRITSHLRHGCLESAVLDRHCDGRRATWHGPSLGLATRLHPQKGWSHKKQPMSKKVEKTKSDSEKRTKAAKAAEKQRAAALVEVNELHTDKKISTPEMIVDLPSGLSSELGDSWEVQEMFARPWRGPCNSGLPQTQHQGCQVAGGRWRANTTMILLMGASASKDCRRGNCHDNGYGWRVGCHGAGWLAGKSCRRYQDASRQHEVCVPCSGRGAVAPPESQQPKPTFCLWCRSTDAAASSSSHQQRWVYLGGHCWRCHAGPSSRARDAHSPYGRCHRHG